jgi:squalene-hopene/tetraprenyl-beta-curcumene cyclase
MKPQLALLICFATYPCLAGEKTWNPQAAAQYLDARAEWWSTWANAKRDHGTFCVSCHTAVPYALSRPMLRGTLKESTASAPEQSLTANVAKRVGLWSQTAPFYLTSATAPNRSEEARGTEAILNALILTASGAPNDQATAAFRNMWAAQVQEGKNKGSFLWLDFHNRPWEADDSQYYGSALAAVAVGLAPASQHAKAQSLIEYLKQNYAEQTLANRVMVLWASANLPALLTASQKTALVNELAAVQQPDGGWSLTHLAGTWKRRDGAALVTASDGYATGLTAYSMEAAGVPKSEAALARALAWLKTNQSETDGRWLGYSLNKDRDLNTDVGKFMSDAATAYAVLALTAK